MKQTTLCYIEDKGSYLMLYRNKLKNDPNKGKWLGIGGKLLPDESPDEACRREVKEETGLTLTDFKYRGIVSFISDIYPDEAMHLYYTDSFEGEVSECDEGELRWIEKDKLYTLPMWEGDKIFLQLMEKDIPFFELTLKYNGDTLVSADLDGEEYNIVT